MGAICRHFQLAELVPPAVLNARGEHAWELLDAALLETIDLIRDRYGPITINNWQAGGTFGESGLRLPGTATGALWSQHKYGRAADLKFANAVPKDVQADILAHAEHYPRLTCMEDAAKTVTWLHVDVRNHQQPMQIWIVQP